MPSLADPLGAPPPTDPLGALPPGDPLSSAPQKTYDAKGLSSLWVQAGGDLKDADLMANVALNESSGDPSAKNQYTENGKTYHVHGLWQISDINGPGNYDDPLENAKKAVAMHRGSGMTPWESSRTKGGLGGWQSYMTKHASSHAEADARDQDFPPGDPLGGFKPAAAPASITQQAMTPAPAHDPLMDGMPTALQSQLTNKPRGDKVTGTTPQSVHDAMTDGFTKAIDYTSLAGMPGIILARDRHFQAQQRAKLSGKALADFNRLVERDTDEHGKPLPPEERMKAYPNAAAFNKAIHDGDLAPDKIHKLAEMATMVGDGPGSFSDVIKSFTDLGKGADHGVKPAETFGGKPLSLQTQLSGHSTPKNTPSVVGEMVTGSTPALDAAADIIPQMITPAGAVRGAAAEAAGAVARGVRATGVLDKAGTAATRAINSTNAGAKTLQALQSVQQGVAPFSPLRRAASALGLDPDLAEQAGRTYVNAPARAKENALKTVKAIYTNSATGKYFTPAERIEIERLSEGLAPKIADTHGELKRAAQDVRDTYTRMTNDQTALDLMKTSQVFDPGQYTFRGGDVYAKKEVPPELKDFWDDYRSGNMRPNAISGSTKNAPKTFMNYDEAEPYLDKAKYDPADQLLSYLTTRGSHVGREQAVRGMLDMGLIEEMPLLDKDGNLLAKGAEVDAVAGRLAARTARNRSSEAAFNELNRQRVARGQTPLQWTDVATMQKAVREKGKFRQRGQEATIAANEAERFAQRARSAADRTQQVAGDALKQQLDRRVADLDKINKNIEKYTQMAQQGDREAAGRSLSAAMIERDKISIELDNMREKVQRTAEDVYGNIRTPSPNAGLDKASEAYYDAVEKHGPDSPGAEAAFKATQGMNRVDEPRPDIYAPTVGRIQDIYQQAKELPPGPARAKVLRMLTQIGKRGVKGPTKISDTVNSERLLKKVQQAMSHVAAAGRDMTSQRIVKQLNDLSQQLERGISQDDSRLYSRRDNVGNAANRAADIINAGSGKAAARQKKILDAYDFAKQSEGDVQAFKVAFKNAMAHETTAEKERILNQARNDVKMRDGMQPFVEKGKEGTGDAARGSPTLKFAVAKPDVVRFFASMGAPLPEAHGIGTFIDGMNRLSRMGMISNPVVHAGWNLGTHYLAAGGSPEFFAERMWKDPSEWGRVGSKTGAEWQAEADHWNAIVHMADTHPIFGGSFAANTLDSPGDHGVKHLMNAGLTQLWHKNQRIVFEDFETRYSVDLFRHFVEDEKMTPQAAGIKVRQTLGDYTNVSRMGIDDALQKTLLFYPWMKTAIPFWIKTLVTRPSFVAVPGIGIRRWDQAMGDPDVGNENPLTIDLGTNADGGRKKITYPGPQKWVGDIMNVIQPKNGDTDPVGARLDAMYKVVAGHLRPWGGQDAASSIVSLGAPIMGTYGPNVKAQDPSSNFSVIANRDAPVGTQAEQIAQHYAGNLPGVELGEGIVNGIRGLASGDVRGAAGATGGFQYDTLSRGKQTQLRNANGTLDRAMAKARNMKNPVARAAAIKAAQRVYDTHMSRLSGGAAKPPTLVDPLGPMPAGDPLGSP
jgi:hypothetical protein